MSPSPPATPTRRVLRVVAVAVLALFCLALPAGADDELPAGAAGDSTSPPAGEAAAAPRAPRAGAKPTQANTGPTSAPTRTMGVAAFLRTRTCRNARITNQLRVQAWSNLRSWDQTFTIDNCVLEGGFYWLVDNGGDYPVDWYPTINITNTNILGSMILISPAHLNMDRSYVSHGGFWAPCGDCAGSRFGLVRSMPVQVTNSLFVHPQGRPPSHTEALHVAGTGQGYRFTNTRFVQKGPMNGTQTGALFFHGGNSRFDSCWFDYGHTRAAAYYTIYIYGRGPGRNSNVVADSAIQKGRSGYVYPVGSQGLTPADYVGNRDFKTGRPILR